MRSHEVHKGCMLSPHSVANLRQYNRTLTSTLICTATGWPFSVPAETPIGSRPQLPFHPDPCPTNAARECCVDVRWARPPATKAPSPGTWPCARRRSIQDQGHRLDAARSGRLCPGEDITLIVRAEARTVLRPHSATTSLADSTIASGAVRRRSLNCGWWIPELSKLR